jgi:hypothetical protein
VFGLAFALLLPDRGFACSCAPTPTVAEELEQADAVFSGEVTKLEVLPSWWEVADETPAPELLYADPGQKPTRLLRATIAVSRVWKGPAQRSLTVQTFADCCFCGTTWDISRAYLVYAFRSKSSGSLFTSVCARGGLIDASAEDLAQLGPPATDYDSPRREKLKRRALGKE